MRKIYKLLLVICSVSALAGCALFSKKDDQSNDDNQIAHSHVWGDVTYSWSDDFLTCTAKRICSEDSSHVEEETVESTFNVVRSSTCEDDGIGQYLAAFNNSSFQTQTHSVVINKLNHNWGTPTYTWSNDHSTCTAERICLNDSSHIDSETVTSTYEVVDSPTCEGDGLGRYTATFASEAFATRVYEEVLDKLSHNWGTPTYTWSNDHSTCTAKVICQNDSNHIIEETVNSKYELISESTYEVHGSECYSVTFENSLFEAQDIYLDLPLVRTNEKIAFIPGSNQYWYDVEGWNSRAVGEIYIPPTYEGKSVLGIKKQGFSRCTNLTSVIIASGIETIGESAFSGCSSLKSVYIPASVESIGQSAFSDCTSLESVIIEEGTKLNKLSQAIFGGCTSLVSINLPSNILWIELYAFSGCSSLKTVSGAEGVIHIDFRGFENCTSLEKFTVWKSLVSFNASFYGCTNLSSIVVDEENNNFCFENGILYSKDKTKIWLCLANVSGSLHIINGVTEIKTSAFVGCNLIEEITFPNTLKTIPSGCFIGCDGLVEVTLPDSVVLETTNTEIFKDCHALEEVKLPSHGTIIPGSMFYGCNSLVSVDVGDSITTVHYSAFNGCASLQTINLGNSLEKILQSAFANCSSLTSIIFGDTLTEIGSGAFSNCTSLSSFDFGNTLVKLGSDAFSGCTSLTGIISLPSTLRDVQYGPFSYCTGITEFNVAEDSSYTGYPKYGSPQGVLCEITGGPNYIIQYPLGRMSTSIVFNNVTQIQNFAFNSAVNLQSINITGTKLTDIGTRVFANCPNLISVSLKESTKLRYLSQYSFENCPRLVNLYLPGNNFTIYANVFSNCPMLTEVNFNCTKDYFNNNITKENGWLEGSNVKKLVFTDGYRNLS